MSDVRRRDAATVVVRPLDQGELRRVDDRTVRTLFADTLALGRPVADLERLDEYAGLCLGWYLGPGRADAALAVDAVTGDVVGYALVCTDEAAHRRWSTIRSAQFALATVVHLAVWGMDQTSRSFYRSRAADAVDLVRSRRRSPMPAHAHLNVRSGHRSGRVAIALRDHIDQRCMLHGTAGWWAEMNAERGRRAIALDRLGLDIVDRVPNRTLTSAIGRPIERLTLVRRLPAV